MLGKIISFSVNNKLIIGLLVFALIVYGAYETTRLPIDAVPDITNNQVQVITVTPSLGAPDVERLITFPIEQANNNVPGLLEIRSFSRFGLSLVTIVFDDDVDIYWARQQVAERLQQVQQEIPEGIGKPFMAPVSTGLGEIYQYVVKPKKGYEKIYDAMQLRTIQDWIVRRQLLGVKGVADVSSFGGYLKQYEVAVEPNKLKSFGITINDVFDALEQNNRNTGGAYIEKGPTVLYIRSDGLIKGEDDIGNIVVRSTPNGTPLLIKHVGEVRIGNATRYGAMCYNDEGEVAGAVVMMLKGGNSSEVIKNVKNRIDEIQKTLPEGVEIEPFLDRTKMVNNAIGTVRSNLLEGALIVIFVLILFLGNIRAGFIVASVIPLSMLFAVIMMNAFGVIGNLMSLGALDFGLIVDGAVFIVEAVLHQLAHSKQFAAAGFITPKQMDEEVKGASNKMMRSVVFGQIIILIVYLPTFTLQGIEGKMFKPMALTIAFALLGAFILSLTYVPMVSALLISRKYSGKKTISDRMMERLEEIYTKALDRALGIPKSLVLASIAAFAISIVVLSNMGGEFIPSLEEGDFAVETRVLTGSSLSTTIQASQQAVHVLLTKFPEIKKVVTKIGSGEIPTDPMPMDAGDMMIILKDKKEWTTAKTFPELADTMTKALQEVPGITTGFQFPVQMRFNELMTGARQDVVCKIYGENLDTLAVYAKRLGDVAASVDGTQDLYVESVTGLPQIVIEYNRAAIAEFGLNIDEVNKVVNAGFAGQASGMVYEGEKRFELVVRLNGEQRKNITDVQNLLISTPSGSQIPLYQVADVSIKEGPNQIQREDTRRRIVVGFNVSGRDVQSIVEELQAKVDKQIKLPAGYAITYGGAFENLNAAKARLGLAVPVALLLIFLLLYFSFNSIKQGLLIYSAIPLSAMGGIFALAIRDMPFSISAGVGFITLFGVAVLNGIVLVAEFNRLRTEGMTDTRSIVLKGTRIRLRPVLMTGVVASLGFLPMAISSGAGAEVQRPLATVVIGGLLIATLLTLFILPILYMLTENIGFGKKKAAIATVMLVLVCGYSVQAQQTITLQAAIDSAIANNLNLRNEVVLANYAKKMRGTAWDVPQTSVVAEYGQVNSFYNDTKFTVQQEINFPLVYVRQQQVLNQQWEYAKTNIDLKQNDLRKQVSLVYYNLLYLQQKMELLLQIDSMYEQVLQRTNARFNSGEDNAIEKASAEMQRMQGLQQLQEARYDYDIAHMGFKLLLNTATDFVPDTTERKLELQLAISASTHPYLKLMQRQLEIGAANLKLQRSKLLPDIMLAYSNQSFVGVQSVNGVERTFKAGDRFSSVQVGIGIPLFFGGKKIGIDAARIEQQINNGKYLAAKTEMDTRLQQANAAAAKYNTLVQNYENGTLKNVGQVMAYAQQMLANGDINFLQWTVLVNQAINTQSQYLDAVYNLNQGIIELNSLTNKQ